MWCGCPRRNFRVHDQKDSVMNKEGRGRVGKAGINSLHTILFYFHTILQREVHNQENKNSRNPVLWKRNDLSRVGEGWPSSIQEVQRADNILRAGDSRTKVSPLDGNSICVSMKEFPNNAKLWPQWVSGQGSFSAGPRAGSIPFLPGCQLGFSDVPSIWWQKAILSTNSQDF